MAKKKKPTKKSPVKSMTLEERRAAFLAKLPKNDIEWMENLIKSSEAHIDGSGSGVDEFFTQQAERLRKELAEMKEQKRGKRQKA